MEKRHNDVAGLDCASALRPLTLGTGADLAQSAYTRVMQEVRVRKNTEAVLKSKKKKKPLQTKSSTSEVLRHDLKLWKWESNTVSQTQIHPLLSTRAVKKCIFSCDRGGKLRWSKGEKKCFFFVSGKYRTALRSQSQSLWVKIQDLHQIRVLLQFTGSISVVLRPGLLFFF